MLALFCLALVGGCLDTQFSFLPAYKTIIMRELVKLSLFAAALLLLTDREGPWRARLKLTLLALALTCLLAWAMHALAGRTPTREVLRLLRRSPGILLWAAALWLASPMLLNRDKRYGRRMQGAVIALCAYGAFCFASAAASSVPQGRTGSLQLFYRDRVALFLILLPWLRAAQASARLRIRCARFTVYFFALFVLLAALVTVLMLAGGEQVHARLFALGLIHMEGPGADPFLPPLRLTFPMLHFNRTALFMLVATMTMVVAFFARGLKRAPRAACLSLAVLAFVLTIETFTRGAIAALVAGLGLLGCLLSRRLPVVLAGAVVLLLLLLLLPATQRGYLLSTLHYSTYEPRGRMTSMKERRLAWSWGLEQVARHPLTGLGFGPRVIRLAYQAYAEQTGNRRMLAMIKAGLDMQHLHNTPLEIAAESGLPALFAFAAFCLLRWWLLLDVWRGARGPDRSRAAARIAFEASLVVFSMIFYMLKLNAGFIIWYVWAYLLSASEAALRDRTAAARPADAEAPARKTAS